MDEMGESIVEFEEAIISLEEAIITSPEAMESPELLFGKIIVLMGLAVLLIYIVIKLRLPTIMGYLVTGILVGTHGMNLIDNPHRVEALSELGVVLLLFTIGLEFPIQNLMKIRRVALMGGGLQSFFCSSSPFPYAWRWASGGSRRSFSVFSSPSPPPPSFSSSCRNAAKWTRSTAREPSASSSSRISPSCR